MTETREFGPRPPWPAPSAPPERGRRRAPALAVAAVVALVVLAAAGLLVTRDRQAAAPPPPPPPVDWVEVMRELDARRSAAFATGEAERLAEVYARECPCLAIDAKLLRERGPRAGIRHEVVAARAVEEAPGRVTLFVVDRMPPSRGELGWTVDLVSTPEGWRIAAIASA